MLRLPFLDELRDARRVLIAGAGGGYDVFCGLPLYYGLRDAGKQVTLANLSFTSLPHVTGRRLTPHLVEVTADSAGPRFINYFPEGYLCQWLRQIDEDAPVYCFDRTGARPLLAAYQALQRELDFDTLLLVDGGTDSLMRGDEFGLGTPHEDVISIAAGDDLDVPRKLLVCLGFGVDAYHGVCHAQFLEAVAELSRAGAYLGAFSLLPEMPEVERYMQATRAVFNAMPRNVSIVSSSILSALDGAYGDHHATDRTEGSTLWINPLMSLYWCFRLGPVARRILYLDDLKRTETFDEVDAVIQDFRMHQTRKRPWQDIPV